MSDIENEWAKALEEPPGDAPSASETEDQEVDWGAALEEQQKVEALQKDSGKTPDHFAPPAGSEQPSVHPESTPKSLGIEMILHIPIELSVVLGETRMLVNDLVQLGQGSIIELNKVASRAMDLMVNNRLLGKGEVVVFNEHFGVRLTEVISPLDRIKNLG